MKKLKKAAIICAVVMMVSLVPAFALNDTSNNTTGTQVQNQTKTTNQTCLKNGTCDGDHHKHQYSQKITSGTNKCGTCDGDQHKYQYGKKNNEGANKNSNVNGNQYQHGKKNGKASTNCPKS